MIGDAGGCHARCGLGFGTVIVQIVRFNYLCLVVEIISEYFRFRIGV